MLKPSHPGVYIQEKRSGSQTISGVATSVAAFIGSSPKGPIGQPQRVLDYDAFEEMFGEGLSHGEMPMQVRQFFLNGGSTAWIVRVANGAARAQTLLRNIADDTDVLTLTALDAGVTGNQIQVDVDYDTNTPDRTFNLTVYRRLTGPNASERLEEAQSFSNLSLDPNSANFAETVINSQSALISAEATAPPAVGGFVGSASGWIWENGGDIEAEVFATLQAIFPGGQPDALQRRNILISVGDQPPVEATVYRTEDIGDFGAFAASAEEAIETSLTQAGQTATVTVAVSQIGASDFHQLTITATDADGDALPVAIFASPNNDAAGPLGLGVAQGGMEVDAFSAQRPAPTAYVLSAGQANGDVAIGDIVDHFGADPSTFTEWTATIAGENLTGDNALGAIAGLIRRDAGPENYPAGVGGSLGDLEANLTAIAASIQAGLPRGWRVTTEGRNITMRAPNRNPIALGTADIAVPGLMNLRIFSGANSIVLGTATAGADGINPQPGDYDDAYVELERDADIFNLLSLPRCNLGGAQSDRDRSLLWGAASAYCRNNRAFLLMDPPSDVGAWGDANAVDAGVQAMRMGVAGDYAALYWPRLRVADGAGVVHTIDPCGSMAGVYARTDGSRGVWKAPAGLDASILGIRGLEHNTTDAENGITNLLAVNTNRNFAQGAVVWGARTLAGFDNSGEDDWRYVPIRRLALMIEESLYRGLRFAVFEPNAEPLWARIRLSAGAYMNSLFRQGAFKGQAAGDAYFVKCDATTTRQNDINLGIVNVKVGFAPLKPAEFVVVTIQQMAGQIDT